MRPLVVIIFSIVNLHSAPNPNEPREKTTKYSVTHQRSDTLKIQEEKISTQEKG